MTMLLMSSPFLDMMVLTNADDVAGADADIALAVVHHAHKHVAGREHGRHLINIFIIVIQNIYLVNFFIKMYIDHHIVPNY